MIKKQLFLFACLFFTILVHVAGQQKYALLIGVDKYYDRPGVLHGKGLQGCVNDATSIKGMLTRRFGFDENGISTLFDAEASKENVIRSLNNILAKSKAGDAVVFYFSGHGVWIRNDMQNALDTLIKGGMNQAMVMSNLYAPNLECLLTDATVKKIFNRFLDKKVILTAIYDCCFSGNLAMSSGSAELNPYRDDEPPEIDKSISFFELNDIYETFWLDENNKHERDSLTSPVPVAEPDSTRSYNLKADIVLNDSAWIPRPSERKHSMFLALSGTNDIEKGLEIADETGTHHGAYTRSLLEVIKKSGPEIPVRTLIKQVNGLMHTQLYTQSPQHHEDAARLDKNLLGIDPVGFRKTLLVTCTAIKGKEIQLNAGLNDGLANGNILIAANKTKIQVTNAGKADAKAAVIAGNINAIRVNDKFSMTDGRTLSPPLLKVFVQAVDLTPVAFSAFMQKEVMPLTKSPAYIDYRHWYLRRPSVNVFFNDPKFDRGKTTSAFLKRGITSDFLVLLPIPAYIAAPLKTTLQASQNFQIVNSSGEADVSLYLNYVKGRDGNKAHYIFTWYNFGEQQANEPGALRFSSHSSSISALPADSKVVAKLVADIYSMTLRFIRTRTSRWFND